MKMLSTVPCLFFKAALFYFQNSFFGHVIIQLIIEDGCEEFTLCRELRWLIRDIKTQLFILGNLNSKTYYFRFAVLFSYLQYFPLLKPKFFLLKLIFLKNSNFFKTQAFFKLRFFKRTQMFSKLRFFSKLRVFFFQNSGFLKKKTEFFLQNPVEQCACHTTSSPGLFP